MVSGNNSSLIYWEAIWRVLALASIWCNRGRPEKHCGEDTAGAPKPHVDSGTVAMDAKEAGNESDDSMPPLEYVGPAAGGSPSPAPARDAAGPSKAVNTVETQNWG